MIHAYDERYLSNIQKKLGIMFEYALIYKKIDIDDFSLRFSLSKVGKAFEKNDLIYTLGKSESELLSIILDTEIERIELPIVIGPEYWVGYVIAYVSWYYNLPYETIVNCYKPSLLINNYFPYHEMNINKILEIYDKRINLLSSLKVLREKKELTQLELATLSNVPIRTIKAYEQMSLDISKAQGDTLYRLAKVLDCKIEELLMNVVN